jgi:hypothetical protein
MGLQMRESTQDSRIEDHHGFLSTHAIVEKVGFKIKSIRQLVLPYNEVTGQSIDEKAIWMRFTRDVTLYGAIFAVELVKTLVYNEDTTGLDDCLDSFSQAMRQVQYIATQVTIKIYKSISTRKPFGDLVLFGK